MFFCGRLYSNSLFYRSNDNDSFLSSLFLIKSYLDPFLIVISRPYVISTSGGAKLLGSDCGRDRYDSRVNVGLRSAWSTSSQVR